MDNSKTRFFHTDDLQLPDLSRTQGLYEFPLPEKKTAQATPFTGPDLASTRIMPIERLLDRSLPEVARERGLTLGGTSSASPESHERAPGARTQRLPGWDGTRRMVARLDGNTLDRILQPERQRSLVQRTRAALQRRRARRPATRGMGLREKQLGALALLAVLTCLTALSLDRNGAAESHPRRPEGQAGARAAETERAAHKAAPAQPLAGRAADTTPKALAAGATPSSLAAAPTTRPPTARTAVERAGRATGSAPQARAPAASPAEPALAAQSAARDPSVNARDPSPNAARGGEASRRPVTERMAVDALARGDLDRAVAAYRMLAQRTRNIVHQEAARILQDKLANAHAVQ